MRRVARTRHWTARVLTDSGEPDRLPAWSPDGSSIWFVSTTESRLRIGTVDAVGRTTIGPLVTGLETDPLAWSPDTSQLLAVRRTGSGRFPPSSIVSVDATFQRPPTTLIEDQAGSILCLAWQRMPE